MAFDRSGLCRIGGSGIGGSTWQYTSVDAMSVVKNQGYFLKAINEFNIGDVVICTNTANASAPIVTLSYIKTLAVNITAADGVTITAG